MHIAYVGTWIFGTKDTGYVRANDELDGATIVCGKSAIHHTQGCLSMNGVCSVMMWSLFIIAFAIAIIYSEWHSLCFVPDCISSYDISLNYIELDSCGHHRENH